MIGQGQGTITAPLLYLDQNYLSGMVKRKVAFRELEPALRAAVAHGAIVVPEAEAHREEPAPDEVSRRLQDPKFTEGMEYVQSTLASGLDAS